MVTGVFQHAECSGNIPRIIGTLLFCTSYCISQFDSHLFSTYMSMRIAKHICMLWHWGNLLNLSIHQHNPETHSFLCLSAQTQQDNENMPKIHAIRGQEEEHCNTFSVGIRAQLGQLFYVYIYCRKYLHHLQMEIYLAVHVKRGSDEYKCEFM